MHNKLKRSDARGQDGQWKLRIAIFHFGFFYSGGGEKLVLEEVRGLRELGHNVECFAPYVDRDHCFPDIPEMHEIQTLLPSPPYWLPLRHAFWVLACCILAPLFAKQFRSFDVLFAANQPSAWIAFVVARLLRKKYVIYLAQPLRLLHPREIDDDVGLRIKDGDQTFVRWIVRLGRPLIDLADRCSVKGAYAVLSNGSYVGNWLEAIYGRRTVVCPAGCHPRPAQVLKYSTRWMGQISVGGNSIRKPYILLTNRHAPQKRFEYALWAMKRLVSEMPDLTLVITGQETGYTDQLRYLASSLRLEHAVRFIGFVGEAELSKLYVEAAVYVYPSPDEDFGMGIVEAMAAGTPVVAWDKGGPTVTVDSGRTGFLVTPYDTDEFAMHLLLLLQNPGVAGHMGKAAHQRAHRLFTYARHMDILEKQLLIAAKPAAYSIDEHFAIPTKEYSVNETKLASGAGQRTATAIRDGRTQELLAASSPHLSRHQSLVAERSSDRPK